MVKKMYAFKNEIKNKFEFYSGTWKCLRTTWFSKVWRPNGLVPMGHCWTSHSCFHHNLSFTATHTFDFHQQNKVKQGQVQFKVSIILSYNPHYKIRSYTAFFTFENLYKQLHATDITALGLKSTTSLTENEERHYTQFTFLGRETIRSASRRHCNGGWVDDNLHSFFLPLIIICIERREPRIVQQSRTTNNSVWFQWAPPILQIPAVRKRESRFEVRALKFAGTQVDDDAATLKQSKVDWSSST